MGNTNRSMKWLDDAAPEMRSGAEPKLFAEGPDESVGVATVAPIKPLPERAADLYRTMRLEVPVGGRLETSPATKNEARSEIPIVADREVSLQFASLAPTVVAAEHYERLKATLWARYSEQDMKVVLFVATSSGSGTSTTALNYAAMLAKDGRSTVLLIDANLRESPGRPNRRSAAAQKGESVSLSSMVSTQPGPIYPVPGPSNLCVLPSGTRCAAPLSLFQSEAFDEFLRGVRARFDYVIIDAPPLQGFPESLVLSRKADGVILVVEAGKTRQRIAQWAKSQIEAAGGKVLGAVLNKRRFYIPNWLYKRI